MRKRTKNVTVKPVVEVEAGERGNFSHCLIVPFCSCYLDLTVIESNT